MPRSRIRADASGGAYFLTFTVQRWYYLFDRHERWPILAEAIMHGRRDKGLHLFGFVFMLNHLHLIVGAPDPAGFVRDFKAFTTRRLRENVRDTEPRLLPLFQSDPGGFRLWQRGNAPKQVETEAFFQQKLAYVHDNPVRKRYVLRPEHWYWSSANPECELRPDPV